MKNTIKLITTLTVLLLTSTAFANLEAQKQAMLPKLVQSYMDSGQVGYYEAILLTQEMLKTRGKRDKTSTINYTQSKADMAAEAKKTNNSFKKVQAALKKVENDKACLAAYSALMDYARTSSFLSAVNQSLKVINSTAAEDAMWKLASESFDSSNPHQMKQYPVVLDACVK